MVDGSVETFEVDWEGTRVHDADIPQAPKKDRTPLNDKFSRIITDDDRAVIMETSVPFPPIIKAVGDTLRDLDKETSDVFLRKIVALATIGGKIPGVVDEFVSYVGDGKSKLPMAFLNGAPNEYLAIFCGFIEKGRELNKDNPKIVDQIAENFTNKADNSLRMLSAREASLKAVEVVAANLKKEG